MPETFAQYLEKWLKQSTVQGLNNPLVKMPIKRFRLLQPIEFNSLAGTQGGTLAIGTLSEPIARNLYKNFQTRIRERGEHCSFICFGSVEITVSGGIGQQQRTALFPVCLKRATIHANGQHIKITVSPDEVWQFNPVFEAHLQSLGIPLSPNIAHQPDQATNWIKSQLGNRASQVNSDSYVGLFSSQQMVVQNRLKEMPLRQSLARNPVVQAKIGDSKVHTVNLHEITDEGMEKLGLVLPCDDSQLRVVQLSDWGCSLQVEGPPGTGKSQTISNIISNALYHKRNVLLVCDKKAAIVQVEERLSNCGLKPAILNLHDEDLDKREFLRQAIERIPSRAAANYPFDQLRETRKTLNERVEFGRAIAHPSLQVTKREALTGLIRLRKELKNVPNVDVANWQALSRERLTRLLGHLGEWPDLALVLIDNENIWNQVRVEAFENNPNATNELQSLVRRIPLQLASLDEIREWATMVGIENSIDSDSNVNDAVALVNTVLNRPACHPKLVGNSQITLAELGALKAHWDRCDELEAARHPVPLSEIYPPIAELEAKVLLKAEAAISWDDLSVREIYHASRMSEIEKNQNAYRRLCNHIGLVYSPLLKVRRAQLNAILSLGKLEASVPRGWWDAKSTPVLSIAGWKAHLRGAAAHLRDAPVPLHFLALERVAKTHWNHVEAKAEHGFNMISYCLHFVNDMKFKHALRQVYPSIPVHGFKQWRETNLHAVATLRTVETLRSSSEIHAILVQLTTTYFAEALENPDHFEDYLKHEDVRKLESAAVLVERLRIQKDIFETGSIHWQSFWESTNPAIFSQAERVLSDLDDLALPESHTDNLEEAFQFHEETKSRIQNFLKEWERNIGNRTQEVTTAFVAQKEFSERKERLKPLKKYLDLQTEGQIQPDWQWLQTAIEWRDLFERLRRQQKLDVDSLLWAKLRDRLQNHQVLMKKAYEELDFFFEKYTATLKDYDTLAASVSEIVNDLPRHPLWLEKNRWRAKIPAFPEIKGLWDKIVAGSVEPIVAQRLFCFNLLHLCDPVAKPYGPEFKQTLKTFTEQDEKLASWIVEHLLSTLHQSMLDAASNAASSESEIRRLSGLQRIRGTIRELVNAHADYLLAAKRCWMMSPTSLANLIDSKIFEDHGTPFDLVIFDEASQIRILDGLLSMAFGKQVVIVGDKNQLPPTDFFSSFANPEADGEPQTFGVSESLLDEFSGVFEDDKTQVMLMSHYRSETPDLIRFSNDWFYRGKLEMYPPAHISGIGRRLHYVPNAIYSETAGQRNNPIEAAEVVKLIELHVREFPQKSLGVVTMNIPQMELIDTQLQLFISDEVRNFCADESKFFLRNLETVQGDEMDRIIVSLTYGKNTAGHFNASILGPLTKSGGERRLNVAITRSRNGLTFVSSLKTADLETTGAQSKGFQCLKALLMDLENAEQARTFGIGSKRFEKKQDGISNVVYCESPFEEQVVEFLENEGYEVECQYGAGKYRIDIVVKERGRNILAIECDGAAYHSSLVARTRDRARQRILEKMNWKFHRVWSTNWWFFEQQEKQALVDAIMAAR